MPPPRRARRRSRRRGPPASATPGASSRRYATPVAISTLWPASSSPPASVTTRCGPRALQAGDLLHGQQLGAEAARLVVRAAREIGAGEPVREAEVVLDPRALPGLAARRGALDQHGAQALGGAVDGGGEAGRSAADDHEVVEVELGLRGQAEPARQLERRRRLQHAAVAQEHRREPVGGDAGDVEQPARLRVALQVQPLVRARGCGRGSRARRASRARSGGRRRAPRGRRATASACQSPSRSSSVGYSRSSGGSHGFCR